MLSFIVTSRSLIVLCVFTKATMRSHLAQVKMRWVSGTLVQLPPSQATSWYCRKMPPEVFSLGQCVETLRRAAQTQRKILWFSSTQGKENQIFGEICFDQKYLFLHSGHSKSNKTDRLSLRFHLNHNAVELLVCL